MARSKSGEVKSTFWKPEVAGDFVEGIFASWHETQFGIAMKLTGKGNAVHMIGLSTVLFNLVKQNQKLFRKGVPVKIVYDGKKKQAKMFSVFVKGEHLDSSLSFPEATAEAVKDFFSKEYEFKGKSKGKKRK